MSSLANIRSANDALNKRYESATAIFTGATNGIGLATLQSFVKHMPHPTVIVAGRSRKAFDDEIANLKQSNRQAEITFLEADLSLIKNIDAVSEQIATALPRQSVDLVSLSQGYAPIEGRQFTPEGLDKGVALFYYGRIRLLHNLIDAKVLKPDAQVLNVLIGAKEGKVFEDDLALEHNYSIMNMRAHVGSLTTLSFDALSKQHPQLTLLHVYPGTVDTGLLARGVQNWMLWLVLLAAERLLMLFNGAMTAEESGERMLDLALGGKYGAGTFSLDYDGSEGRSEWLAKYRADRPLAERVWQFNEETWAKAVAG